MLSRYLLVPLSFYLSERCGAAVVVFPCACGESTGVRAARTHWLAGGGLARGGGWTGRARTLQDKGIVKPDKLPWGALQALIETVTYGGRIDNQFDAVRTHARTHAGRPVVIACVCAA